MLSTGKHGKKVPKDLAKNLAWRRKTITGAEEDVEVQQRLRHGRRVRSPENHGDLVVADALCHKMMKILGQPMKKKAEAPVLQFGSLAWRVKYHEERVRQLAKESEWQH